MKLKDLREGSQPFKRFGSWKLFNSNREIDDEFNNFAMPLSGPAMAASTSDGQYDLTLGLDPEAEIGPVHQIIVAIHNYRLGSIEFMKSWPDSKDSYRLAAKYAEKLRKGEDPTN